MPVWKLIHILVRWAIIVVAQAEGEDRVQLPRLSQLQLGRLMSRSDPRTVMDIAMDIMKNDPTRTRYSDSEMDAVLRGIRSGFGEMPRSRGYSRSTDSAIVARRLLEAVDRQIPLAYARRAFYACCRTTTWADAVRQLPQSDGRDWQSVRDDFRAAAHSLWTGEAIEVSAAIEQMARVMEEMRQAQRARA